MLFIPLSPHQNGGNLICSQHYLIFRTSASSISARHFPSFICWNQHNPEASFPACSMSFFVILEILVLLTYFPAHIALFWSNNASIHLPICDYMLLIYWCLAVLQNVYAFCPVLLLVLGSYKVLPTHVSDQLQCTYGWIQGKQISILSSLVYFYFTCATASALAMPWIFQKKELSACVKLFHRICLISLWWCGNLL